MALVATLVDPTSLGDLDRGSLVVALRPLWEDSSWLAGRLEGRSFATWGDVVEAAEAEMAAADDTQRSVLVTAHPRLGGDRLRLAERSAMSWAEQGGPVAPELSVSERLEILNDTYEARFGFPFVEFVAGRSLDQMIPIMEARLGNDASTELATACSAMVAIARDRLARLSAPSGPSAPSAPEMDN
jgi:OHCU decarboxylase